MPNACKKQSNRKWSIINVESELKIFKAGDYLFIFWRDFRLYRTRLELDSIWGKYNLQGKLNLFSISHVTRHGMDLPFVYGKVENVKLKVMIISEM